MFDTLTSVCTTLESLARDFDPRSLSAEQSVRVVTQLGAIRRLVDGLLGAVALQVEETGAYQRNGRNDRDAAALVGRVVGTESSEARRAIRCAKRLRDLPATAAAVRAGRLSARQTELITAAGSVNPDAEGDLLAAAAKGIVALKDACVLAHKNSENETKRAARQHAGRRLRMWTGVDGMVEGRFSLTPEVGGRFKAAIDAGTQRIFRARRKDGPHEALEAYAADALTDLVPTDEPKTVRSTKTNRSPQPGHGAGAGEEREGPATSRSGGGGRTVTNVHVVIDHEALVRGNALAGERCEIPGVGPVNVGWVRGMLGDAFVTAIIRKGRDISTVAHFGRHIPAVLRTAMLAGGRECCVEGCSARGYLEIDHADIDFAKGGPTAFWNLRYGCGFHHKLKTQGWILGPAHPITGKRDLTDPTARGTPAEEAAA